MSIVSPLVRSAPGSRLGDEDVGTRLRAALPLRRFGTIDDVAPTAMFLASSAADYYTGQTRGPNGGDVMP